MDKKDSLLVALMGGMMFIWLFIITVVLINANNPKLLDVVTGNDVNVNMISGTEYQPGEAGKIVVEIRDRYSNPLVANCSVTVLYPDGSAWILGALMNQTSIGTYYRDFVVQNLTGVYEYSASCQRGVRNYVVGKSFHVSGAGMKAWVTP